MAASSPGGQQITDLALGKIDRYAEAGPRATSMLRGRASGKRDGRWPTKADRFHMFFAHIARGLESTICCLRRTSRASRQMATVLLQK